MDGCRFNSDSGCEEFGLGVGILGGWSLQHGCIASVRSLVSMGFLCGSRVRNVYESSSPRSILIAECSLAGSHTVRNSVSCS